MDEYIPIVKVQDYFTKNILSRFSTYYSRQGQPDFNFDLEAETICKQITSMGKEQNQPQINS